METEIKGISTQRRAWPFFIAGAALGAVAGIFLAPEAGRETRQKVGDWLKERRMKSRETLAVKRHQLSAAVEAYRHPEKEREEKRLVGV